MCGIFGGVGIGKDVPKGNVKKGEVTLTKKQKFKAV